MIIVHHAGNGRVHVVEAPRPEPGDGEVLVRTAVSALCGSELKSVLGDGRSFGNGGHEAAGTVVAHGPGVSSLPEGSRVGVSAVSGCGSCEACRAGRFTWCDSFRAHANMHAEFFTIPASACHLLPDGLDWETGVLISGDGFGVPYHTATRIDSLDRSVGGNGSETETVAIFGLGPIGLGNLLMQRHRGRRVIGIDRAPARLELASTLGAEATIAATAGQDLVEMARRHTDGRGADIVIEAAGVPETARQCFRVVRRGGLVVFNGEQAEVPLSPSEDFIRRDVTAMGSWFYHFREFPEMLALVRSGLPVSSLITHRFPLAAASDAYGAFAEGKTGKVLLTYDST